MTSLSPYIRHPIVVPPSLTPHDLAVLFCFAAGIYPGSPHIPPGNQSDGLLLMSIACLLTEPLPHTGDGSFPVPASEIRSMLITVWEPHLTILRNADSPESLTTYTVLQKTFDLILSHFDPSP